MGVCRLNDAEYGVARRIDIMGIVQEEWYASAFLKLPQFLWGGGAAFVFEQNARRKVKLIALLVACLSQGVCGDVLHGLGRLQPQDAAARRGEGLHAQRAHAGAAQSLAVSVACGAKAFWSVLNSRCQCCLTSIVAVCRAVPGGPGDEEEGRSAGRAGRAGGVRGARARVGGAGGP